ncbi:lipopolysaccharide/colanic/teichoic acid biosynthesis glycosyltransferase [Variovorax paradoxus]|uniref:Lipopolysaccharide/colanic/teichoic acid biosynthesis glycosyltransferase n=1 Tax=Variovorax paradoxus TaxID=34073 RepID=A0AAW8EEB3_VARPD|nr:lipopolysaccharide/colanic/teichoic acid biosynthesis glycosyltransferase [Variovorax paradoxus]
MKLMAKRVFDIGMALGALLILSPILGAVAIWIRLDSPGPALFRQERVGLAGRRFQILKFRTMRQDAAVNGPQITVGEDVRITRAGVFLRRHKLDELPQFFNVLNGEMSVVGPRPEVPRYVELYSVEVKKIILSVRPGITDPASLAFADESSLLNRAIDPESHYVNVVMPLKLEHSIQYVQTQNFRNDLQIIWKTMVAVFYG